MALRGFMVGSVDVTSPSSPNTSEMLKAARADLEAFAKSAFGAPAVTLIPHDANPRRRFGVSLSAG